MKVEWTILVIVWITAFSLFFFIPRKTFRLAQVAILFKQFLTWVIGLVVVELGWIEYPVREFASVNRSSFTFEYLAYPIIFLMHAIRRIKAYFSNCSTTAHTAL
nr:CBO0543 family protein [Paenibacillus sedimenti]